MSWKRYKMRDFPASWRPQKTCLTPFSMLFPILCALVSGSEFQHTDPLRKEFCGQMAGLVAEKGGNRLESSSRKAFLRGSFSPCERPKVERVRGWGGPCGEVTRVLWCGHEGVVVRSRGCCGAVMRVLWYGHEGVVVRSWGCCGAVTRVSWTIYDNLPNDGLIRMTAQFCANCYIIALN